MSSKKKEIRGTSLDFTPELASELKPAAPDGRLAKKMLQKKIASELKPAAPDGKLAKKLNLPVPETSFVDADSLVTPAFVSRTGFDYQACATQFVV